MASCQRETWFNATGQPPLTISGHRYPNDRSSGSACHAVQLIDRRGHVQVIPPAERAKAVSLTTSGMYLGSAAAMLALPRVAQSAGPASIFRLVGLLALLWLCLWRLLAPSPVARYCQCLAAFVQQVLFILEEMQDTMQLNEMFGSVAPPGPVRSCQVYHKKQYAWLFVMLSKYQ